MTSATQTNTGNYIVSQKKHVTLFI